MFPLLDNMNLPRKTVWHLGVEGLAKVTNVYLHTNHSHNVQYPTDKGNRYNATFDGLSVYTSTSVWRSKCYKDKVMKIMDKILQDQR